MDPQFTETANQAPTVKTNPMHTSDHPQISSCEPLLWVRQDLATWLLEANPTLKRGSGILQSFGGDVRQVETRLSPVLDPLAGLVGPY